MASPSGDYLVSIGVDAYWPLGEASGDAIDLSGNGNDGTVTFAAGQRAHPPIDDDGDGSLGFEEGTVNDALNPRLGTNDTGWEARGGAANAGRVEVPGEHGDWSYEVNVNASTQGVAYVRTNSTRVDAGTVYSASALIHGDAGRTIQMFIVSRGGDFEFFARNYVLTEEPTRVPITFTWQNTDHTGWELLFRDVLSQGAFNFFVTEIQYEQKPWPTSYCDGSLGTGYSWSGTAHASTSTRVASSTSFGSPSDLDNLWAGGNRAGFLIKPAETDSLSAFIMAKRPWDGTSGWVINLEGQRVRLRVSFSDNIGVWRTTAGLPIIAGREYAMVVTYNSDSPDNDPSILILDLDSGERFLCVVGDGLQELESPSGAYVSDASDSFSMGQIPIGSAHLNANLDEAWIGNISDVSVDTYLGLVRGIYLDRGRVAPAGSSLYARPASGGALR